MTKTKVCSKCGQEIPIEKFAVGNTLKRTTICNFCQSERTKKSKDRYDIMPWYEVWYLKG